MFEEIIDILLTEGIDFIYTANKGLRPLKDKIEKTSSAVHFEVATNEKIAYELAFAASIVKKRSAFLTNTHNLFEAIDPIMSSAYMGVLGAMLVIVIRDTEDDVAFLGPFSKLPVIIEENQLRLREAVSFGSYISERFEIPVLLELGMADLKNRITYKEKKSTDMKKSTAQFVKDTSRWAATPSFRYHLHVLLNEKIKKIKEEFESYSGNRCNIKGKTGFVTYRESEVSFFKDDFSTLVLSTVHPLPSRFVSNFMEKMDDVFIVSDPHSVIQFQLDSFKEKIRSCSEGRPSSRSMMKKDEVIFGYRLIRDAFGPASSMNMAHAIKKLNPEEKILALTYEDNFFHSGIPAFINTLYNDSDYHLLIITKDKEAEIINFMEALNFQNYYILREFGELERYTKQKGFTVFILKGGI